MDDLDLRNARTVVASWRENNHLAHWRPIAHGRPPHELVRLGADAWKMVAECADAQADNLITEGFMPGHETVRQLREQASLAAQRATWAFRWAAALEAAHDE